MNLDAKGRMAIPARYRDSIAEVCHNQMVVTIDPHSPCLLLYPPMEWQAIEARLIEFPSFNKEARRIQRLLIGHATDLELDGSGRLLLPSLLRDHAKLEKKVVLLGQGKKFEIWDEDHWNQTRDDYLNDADTGTLPAEMADFSL